MVYSGGTKSGSLKAFIFSLDDSIALNFWAKQSFELYKSCDTVELSHKTLTDHFLITFFILFSFKNRSILKCKI